MANAIGAACKMRHADWLGRLNTGETTHEFTPRGWRAGASTLNEERIPKSFLQQILDVRN